MLKIKMMRFDHTVVFAAEELKKYLRMMMPETADIEIILDPEAKSNSHELRIKGAFGEMNCHTYNVPSPDNPKTSMLASLSAISALKRIIRNEWAGI